MVVLTFCIDKQMQEKKVFPAEVFVVSFDGRNSLWRKVIVSSWSRSYSPIDNCSLFTWHKEYHKQLQQSRHKYSFFSSSAKAAGGFKQLHNNLCMSFWMVTKGILFLYSLLFLRLQLRQKSKFRKLQIFISQTTDFHFTNYRFSFCKLQIFISQTTDFHFVSFHFVSFRFAPFRFANYSKPFQE